MKDTGKIREGKYTRNRFVHSFVRTFIFRFVISRRLKEPCIPAFYWKYFGTLFKKGNEREL
jgi:hypothetical protein